MNTTDSTQAPAPVIASVIATVVDPPVITPTPIRADRLLRTSLLADRAGLRIEGELDRSTLPALRRALATMASGDAGSCVDLSGLTFIDTGCLRALVNAAAALREGGGDQVLTLRSVPPQMRRLLELIGWDRVQGLHLQASARPG
ncbi:STAS domain-containing protein [Nonomuraea sp. LPB2021202275-12-8]|uniref:STAS domain-containing protein n=1 Tax=Nonomuraea sp. LPB2021202275-12-8 TaxID=3120159 RepID=UPI00300DBD22